MPLDDDHHLEGSRTTDGDTPPTAAAGRQPHGSVQRGGGEAGLAERARTGRDDDGTATGWPPWRLEAGRLVLLFLVTRLTLTAIGLVSRALVPGPVQRFMPVGVGTEFSTLPFLDLWGEWDSAWYLSVAQDGYQAEPLFGQYANYAFFPLFPFLSRAVGWLFGNVFVGSLVVANVTLLVACVFLYRLVHLDHDVATARRTVKYLFAAPPAFFLSAALSESLYLALVIMCFYFARTRRWWLVGISGFLLTLSRGPGILAAVPLAWIYLSQRGLSLRRVRPDVLWLAGLPAGIALFMWVNHQVTGDALAFSRIQATAWGHELQNPLTALWRAMSTGDIFDRSNAWYMFGVLLVTIAFLRKLGVAYGTFALLSVLFALAYGPPFNALLRYSVVIFPLYIVLARFTESRPTLDQGIVVAGALLQGFLMSVWANSSALTI